MNVADLEHVTLLLEEKQKYVAIQPEDVAQLAPPDRLKYERAQLENVYGHDVVFWNDPKSGKRVPKERGHGAPGHETPNSRAADERNNMSREINQAILDSVKQRT
jgi:hypothetical protein